MNKLMTFSLTPETEEKLNFIAQMTHINKSMLIRLAINMMYEKEQKKAQIDKNGAKSIKAEK